MTDLDKWIEERAQDDLAADLRGLLDYPAVRDDLTLAAAIRAFINRASQLQFALRSAYERGAREEREAQKHHYVSSAFGARCLVDGCCFGMQGPLACMQPFSGDPQAHKEYLKPCAIRARTP